MINLLPPNEQQELRREDTKKVAVILGITVAVPLVCLLLILLSIRWYLLGQLPMQQLVLVQAKQQYQTPDFLRFKEIIKKNNTAMLGLVSFHKDNAYMASLLEIASQIPRPQNLYFKSLSLQKDKDKKVRATLTGFATSREDLLQFQTNVQAVSNIKNPYFSPESWINPTDANFTLTFEMEERTL